jgi:hypothetical protein
MRTLGVVLLAFTASLVPAQQPAVGTLGSASKLSIPAQLSKTVRADKVHPGDPVKFRTLEPVLVSNGMVMPTNTLLVGRILKASPKQEGKNSWLALVVERAEWKQHRLPLHAFVAAQINVSPANNQAAPLYPNPRESAASPPPRAGRQTRVVPRDDLASIFKTPQEAAESNPDEPTAKYPRLENVGIVRDKDGTVYLVSSKANVKLPAGVLLILRNEPAGGPETAAARTSSGALSSQQQP